MDNIDIIVLIKKYNLDIAEYSEDSTLEELGEKVAEALTKLSDTVRMEFIEELLFLEGR